MLRHLNRIVFLCTTAGSQDKPSLIEIDKTVDHSRLSDVNAEAGSTCQISQSVLRKAIGDSLIAPVNLCPCFLEHLNPDIVTIRLREAGPSIATWNVIVHDYFFFDSVFEHMHRENALIINLVKVEKPFEPVWILSKNGQS